MTERYIPKSEWGGGPWQSEPDEESWRDEASGYQCYIFRAPVSGALNGYVGVPKTHPAHGLTYYFDVDFDPEKKPQPWNFNTGRPVTPAERDAYDRTQREWYQRQVNYWTAAQGRMPTQALVNNLTCHGGLTFADDWPDVAPDLWFFGFDTAHAGDLCPAMRAFMRRLPEGLMPRLPRPAEYKETYRRIGYVRRECARLAQQLADIEHTVGRITVLSVAGKTREEIAQAIADTVNQIANQGTS